jgi:hypothetical protein
MTRSALYFVLLLTSSASLACRPGAAAIDARVRAAMAETRADGLAVAVIDDGALLSIVPQYIGRLYAEYPEKRSDTGETADAHHDRSVPEEQRSMSGDSGDSYVGTTHRQRDERSHHHAADRDAHCDLKERPADNGRHDV